MLQFLQWLIARERMMRLLSPLFGRFHPFLPEHRRDPHATWRRLREEAPVYRSRALGTWIVTRYDDVQRVLRDPNFTTDRNNTVVMKVATRMARRDPDLTTMITRSLLTIDGPEHRRLRGLVSKAFTPRRIEALRPRLSGIVDELLDRVEAVGEMELIRDLAHPLPVIAISELLGVPESDRKRFLGWSGKLVELLDPLQASGGSAGLSSATHEIFDYFRELLALRRAEPGEDLLSAMIAAEENGESLSEPDLLALSVLLLVAGHETTSNLIGDSVLALLAHPGERKRLSDDPGIIGSAVDEFLRFESPIQLTDRAALEDCEIGGRRIRRGQLVVAALAAANRDPKIFPDPDRLDLGRRDNHHLAFSLGSHYCLGSQLAKLEAELAIGGLLRRFPDFSGDSEPPAWRRSMIIRGPESVPLLLSQ